MSIIAGILVCAFVYVIRESLTVPAEEDYESEMNGPARR
ncbi:hypothetical protein PAE9249_00780 [Paenibacillus sp. CECT 9249]|nr:hypothetical protein PAE9249_00780 [Paenibacillus sp. CECT 9249]